ncbi:MAG: histidine kinase [Alphaproteobacteria bacterium CG_4_9_14_3_um_filter_47_13]|nr:MAG: histidine kinase [Alphaproteobacteria bacterium CG_4_9_14_3_um_filter_47_13]
MELDTNIKKNKVPGLKRGWKAGGLTLRILSVNVLPLVVLVVGLLSLGQYHENLIEEHLKMLQERAQNFAVAIEGPQEDVILTSQQARNTIRKLGKNRPDTRIFFFNARGSLIGDSYKIGEPDHTGQIIPQKSLEKNFGVSDVIAYLGTNLLKLLPTKKVLPSFPDEEERNFEKFTDIKNALSGIISATAWEAAANGVILTAAAPVIKQGSVVGVMLLVNDGRDIENGMDRVRFDVLTATLAALSLTIFLSLYLASVIGRPLKKLAVAAEKVRGSKDRKINIPDLSHRNDEIGELSMALRDMTQALWDRMDTIERFAADVAHEIKNPLTSLRSAVETVAKVKTDADREKLMAIIQHDVLRLDRLISDISNASRLDAELSRDEMGTVNLRHLLQQLVDAHNNQIKRSNGHRNESPVIQFDVSFDEEMHVSGNEGRLLQVFENLISNALSFSPKNGVVMVRIIPDQKQVRVSIEDQGGGIPENKLEHIFERFYSERPKGEQYGNHSGLGLSIARQIISAHGGEIYAENIIKNNKIQGACFHVILGRKI